MTRFQWMKEFAKAGYGLFRQPANTTALLRVGDLIAETSWFMDCIRRLKLQHADFASGGAHAIPSLEVLKSYEPSTLGYQYYEFMTKHGLSVYQNWDSSSVKIGNSNSSSESKAEAEKIWLRERSRTIHDFLHVILGLGIEVESEIKLNAHLMYSLNLPISRLIVNGGMLRLLLTDLGTFRKVRRELRGIKKWSEDRPCLLLTPVESWLNKPVCQIRAMLELT